LGVRAKGFGCIEQASNGGVNPRLAWVGSLQLDSGWLVASAANADQLACWNWQINLACGWCWLNEHDSDS
jgi:hypothetical protein